MAFFRFERLRAWRRMVFVASLISGIFGGQSMSQDTLPADDPGIVPDASTMPESASPSDVPLTAPLPGFLSRTQTPPPDFLAAPHPLRTELGDLKRLLTEADPESLSLAEECMAEMEAKPGRREAENKIRQNPLKYHWCFYRMVMNLEETLHRTEGYVERKRTVIATYARLVVLAQSFHAIFKDKRYLEFAAEHYRRLNDYLFARKLASTDERREDLHADRVDNPFPFWRPERDTSKPVLERHGIKPQPFLQGILAPEREPASAEAP